MTLEGDAKKQQWWLLPPIVLGQSILSTQKGNHISKGFTAAGPWHVVPVLFDNLIKPFQFAEHIPL
eukprot:11683963-Karenia_brevis.AAC.1